MKKQRRKTSCRRTAIATTEVWDAQFRQALPAAVASALTTNQALHDWATDLGMAVLSELIGSGAKTSAGGGQRKGQPFPPFNRAPTVQPSDSALLHGPDPGQQVVEGVAIGDLLLDKYKIERIMGIGGMGVVVAAKHIHLKMRVAIKFLLPEAGQTSENLSRFLREAQLVARMKSRHVAQMLDVGTLDSGIPYMVMEYLEGKDLFEWLQDRGPLPVTQAIDFIAQACEAIHEAHGLGIVHRDLKPANLFCTTHANGQLTIKVLDFGISKVMDPGACEPESEMTQVRAVLGSPPYMSPEQSWSTRDVDERTDIWSLGVVLYELLTGHAPFFGRTDLQLRMKIATLPPPPLRTRRPEIPRKLEGVVLKCLEKDRDHRYPSVAALTQALSPFGTQPTSARKTTVRGPASNSSVGVFVIAIALALFVMRDSPSPSRTPEFPGLVGHRATVYSRVHPAWTNLGTISSRSYAGFGRIVWKALSCSS